MKRIEYTIKEVEHSELARVKEINELVLPENYPFFFYETLYQNYKDVFLVAETGNKIVGYVMCRIERDVVFQPLPRFKKVGHIVSIAVLPEYRNKGIGTALMNEVLSRMRRYYDVEYVYLEVRVSNEGAIRFYRRLGFKITNRVKGYYRDGEDAYIMTLYFQ
ncbi:ribosomal-protein-alanine N-acetyltransferase [Candidatus Geothermarchaeota archaeon]|nr:MAG: ribosomal-protein-alanine N-acetyltransferase [Candidatus Geothermarchaeota archaeon]HEW93855.1 ribosomal-protein-alanine N-acetyltransferase [Thermoprotei archaeon]